MNGVTQLAAAYSRLTWRGGGVASVCLKGHSRQPNLIVLCDTCDAAVHQRCFGKPLAYFVPDSWLCRACARRAPAKPSAPRDDDAALRAAIHSAPAVTFQLWVRQFGPFLKLPPVSLCAFDDVVAHPSTSDVLAALMVALLSGLGHRCWELTWPTTLADTLLYDEPEALGPETAAFVAAARAEERAARAAAPSGAGAGAGAAHRRDTSARGDEGSAAVDGPPAPGGRARVRASDSDSDNDSNSDNSASNSGSGSDSDSDSDDEGSVSYWDLPPACRVEVLLGLAELQFDRNMPFVKAVRKQLTPMALRGATPVLAMDRFEREYLYLDDDLQGVRVYRRHPPHAKHQPKRPTARRSKQNTLVAMLKPVGKAAAADGGTGPDAVDTEPGAFTLEADGVEAAEELSRRLHASSHYNDNTVADELDTRLRRLAGLRRKRMAAERALRQLHGSGVPTVALGPRKRAAVNYNVDDKMAELAGGRF